MVYKLIQMLAPINQNGARPGKLLKKINGVTIHMTDNWGVKADAIAHANYLKHSGSTIQASWHYCVDDTNITQSIPDKEVAYHSASLIGNTTTIAIEICLNPESNLKNACDNAVVLTAYLLKKYNLTAENIYRHYDWSGKWCPSLLLDGNPYSWDTFKQKVKKEMKNTTSIKPVENHDKTDTSSKLIGVGSIVNFDGNSRCYSSSNGGAAGIVPKAGKYEVTYYKPGALFSVHIGTYGWVPAENCELVSNIKVNDKVYFNGNSHCYATSYGMGQGIIPPEGYYTITHYNQGAKYPIHIGTYGWVSFSDCKLV